MWWLFYPAQAYDPDVPPPEYYGERETVGGSNEWTFGDYWVVGGMVLIVAMLYALPRIFDGKSQDWPVHKFALFNFIEQRQILYKFPTRSLCESY